MNDRIVGIISKADTHAWFVADKYVASDCCNNGEVNYLWEDAFREKFAELIIRECANVCGKDSLDYRYIKEHFGVKE